MDTFHMARQTRAWYETWAVFDPPKDQRGLVNTTIHLRESLDKTKTATKTFEQCIDGLVRA